MSSCVKTGSVTIFSFFLSFYTLLFSPSIETTHCCKHFNNCRTVQPIYGYILKENSSYQTLYHISLEQCIILCEQSLYCTSVSYKGKQNICCLNNITRELTFGDFIQEDNGIYVENVLRPSPCSKHVCKSCACWCEKVKPDGDCEVCGSKPLGMQNGDIKDSQISGSPSVKTYEPKYGRLGNPRGWMGLTPSTSMYIQVSFLPGMATITHIASQGSRIFPQCLVTKYTVEYTTETNLTEWQVLRNEDKSTTIFQGNVKSGTTHTNELPRPLDDVTAIKIRVHRWSASCIAMRIELFGC